VSHLLGRHATFTDNENVWLFSEHEHSFQISKMAMGTPHCVGVLGTLQQMDMCQENVPNLKESKHNFLLPDGAEGLAHHRTWLH
jgi:hypothetical protein